MRWASLKHRIDQMTDEQLQEEACVYHPRYARFFPITTVVKKGELPNASSEHTIVLDLEEAAR